MVARNSAPRGRQPNSERPFRQMCDIYCAQRRWTVRHTTWTERYPNGVTRTRDLLSFVDALAAYDGHTIAIQYTSADHVAARVAKIRCAPNLEFAKEAGWTVLVLGFDLDSNQVKEVVVHDGLSSGGSTC